MENLFPKLKGNVGEMFFELYDGTKTVKFFSSTKLNRQTGSYEICDDNGNIVEYMDLLGNFSDEPTEFAIKFYEYLVYAEYSKLVYRTMRTLIFRCALVEFPSKFLVDEKIANLVKEIERTRFQELCENNVFMNHLEKLRYRNFVEKVIKAKLTKAKKLKKHIQIVNDTLIQTK